MHTKVEVASTGSSVSVDFKALFDSKSKAAIESSLKILQSSAQDAIRFRRKSGKLENAIKYKLDDNDQSGEVYIDLKVAPYGKFITEGTGLYGSKHKKILINAHGGVLNWEQHGHNMFASAVSSPGFRGQRFLDESFNTSQASLDELWDGAFDEVMKEAGF